MGKEKIILTGDRPTGRLHIGHYVGSLKRRVELQNSGLYIKQDMCPESADTRNLSRYQVLQTNLPCLHIYWKKSS